MPAIRHIIAAVAASLAVLRGSHSATANAAPTTSAPWSGRVSVAWSRIKSMASPHLALEDIVAVAAVVETMLGRPLTPNESSRLKSAYQRSDWLPALAREIAA